jgi:hypothetical protein
MMSLSSEISQLLCELISLSHRQCFFRPRSPDASQPAPLHHDGQGDRERRHRRPQGDHQPPCSQRGTGSFAIKLFTVVTN